MQPSDIAHEKSLMSMVIEECSGSRQCLCSIAFRLSTDMGWSERQVGSRLIRVMGQMDSLMEELRKADRALKQLEEESYEREQRDIENAQG